MKLFNDYSGRTHKEEEKQRMNRVYANLQAKRAGIDLKTITKDERQELMDMLNNDKDFLHEKEVLKKASYDFLQKMGKDTPAAEKAKQAAEEAMKIIMEDGVIKAMKDDEENIYAPINPGENTVIDVGKMAKRAVETNEELNMSIAVGVAVALNKMQILVDNPEMTKTFMFKEGIKNITNALKTKLELDEEKIDEAKQKARDLASEISSGGRRKRKSKKSKKSKRSRRGKKQIKKTKKYKKRSNKKRSNKK